MAIPRRRPKGALVSTRIPLSSVNTVSTQAANKRQPNEADTLDNIMVSLERGLEKRPGFEILPQYTIPTLTGWDFTNNDTKYNLFSLPANNDLFFYWYSINEDNTFLIVIDYDATGVADKLFYAFQINSDGTWKDLTPQTQWDTGIAAGNATVTAYATANGLTYAQAAALGVVSSTSRSYITYGTGSKTAKDSLRIVSLGANMIVLNTNVSAGFSSDVGGKLYNLDGTVSATDDVTGRKVTYYTASKVVKWYDYGDDTLITTNDDLLLGYRPNLLTGLAQGGGATHIDLAATSPNIDGYFPTNGSEVTITAGTGAGQTRTITSYVASTKRALVSVNWTTHPDTTSTYSIVLTNGAYIPAEDYFYYSSSLSYLGQRVSDLSDIRLPPENDDWYSNNSNLTTSDVKARDMLRVLHDPDTQYNGIIDGRGKIYYTINPYLNTAAGYYRVVSWQSTGPTYYYDSSKNIYTTSGAGRTAVTSTGRPYLQKIRTPDEHSYIDPRRMPQKIKVNIVSGSAVSGNAVSMSIEPIKWTPRTSGTKDTNPGPSIFKTIDGKELKQVQIKSIAVFKDRLWFAAEDVVFSTQMGIYEDLFINDPTNIITTDPIDIRLSSNNFAEITNMVPFEEYLFLDTKANTQFQLMGASTAELSPTNVAVAPVTYYATASITNPQLIGSRLYFFAPERLYLFLGKNAMGYSSAVETSSLAAGYLPATYKAVCTAPAQDSIVMVDGDVPSDIYMFISRFSGDRVIQNSFYRYRMNALYDSIESVQSYKNYLYAVTKVSSLGYVIKRTKLISEELLVPRMDNLIRLKLITGGSNPNVSYDAATHTTIFKVPSLKYTDEETHIVLDSTWTGTGSEPLSFTVIDPYEKTVVGSYTQLKVRGNYVPASGTKYIYLGNMFESRVTLSTLFVRDENNNIIDGVLNIRTGVFRHYNTGNYDVEVTHRGRTPLVSKYTAQRPDYTLGEDPMPLEAVENQGEFVAKVFGYSGSTDISIVSEYCSPMNITDMEFKGKFKQKYTTLS